MLAESTYILSSADVQVSLVVLDTWSSMSVCFDDWSFGEPAFPGSSCRTLDFNLAFSSLLLSIVPNACFFWIGCMRLVTLNRKSIKASSDFSVLYTSKLVCGTLVCLGATVALIGGSIGDGLPALGITSLALAIPVAVSSILTCSGAASLNG